MLVRGKLGNLMTLSLAFIEKRIIYLDLAVEIRSDY